MRKLWRGAGYDGLGILFLGWLYGVSIVRFDWIAWSLIASGTALIILTVVTRRHKLLSSLKSRRTQVSANALVVIVLVIGIIGLLNSLSVRHSWRIDSTSQKRFSLSEQTVKILRNLEEKVTLTAFVDQTQTGEMEDRLREYGHYSGKFRYEIIDPIKEPAKVREFFGPDKQYLDLPTLLLRTEGSKDWPGKEEEIHSVEEEAVTNALIKVTRKEREKIYFVLGHGEKTIFPDEPGMEGYQFVRENLEKQYFDVDELSLFQEDEVPGDGDVVVIAGPLRNLAPNEIKALGRFLDQGGSVMALLDPEVDVGLDSLLEAWNVIPDHDMVLESHSSFVLSAAGLSRQSNVSIAPSSAEYGDHTITRDFRYATSFIKARSLTIVDEESDTFNTTPLVYTSRNSWGETDLERLFSEGKVSQDEDDIPGPTIVAAAVERTRDPKGRFVLVGDSDFASDVYVQQAPGNMDFFLNAVSWLAEEEDLISVRPKNPENRPLTMTVKQQRLTLFLLIILLPLAAVRWGLHVYTKRS
ncbi:MAG: GldG family protein [Fidelibacterota bacterium]